MFGRKQPVAISTYVLQDRLDLEVLAQMVRTAPKSLLDEWPKPLNIEVVEIAGIFVGVRYETRGALNPHLLATIGDTVVTYSNDTISILRTADLPHVKRQPYGRAERVVFED